MRSVFDGIPILRLVRFVPAGGALLLASCGGYGGGSAMPPVNPSISLSVQPATIVAGQSATIMWSASNATSCMASGAWSGNEATSGQMSVTPKTTGANTYTLTCTNTMMGPYGGSVSSSMSATLTVNPATVFAEKDLVADTAMGTATTDANLVNPWGIAFLPGAPAWVANNHTDTSTLYDGAGVPQPAGSPLVVHLPAGAGGVKFDPTGIVGNTTADFVVSAAGKSAAALFIYSGEGGMIAGWSQGVDVNNAVVMYADAAGAVYKGLALANNGSGNFLYATDFHNNKVDVFDKTFTKQPSTAASFTFKDPALPAGYAPFGIQALNTGAGGTVQIYVTYAKQMPPGNHDNLIGAGLGIVDVYDANGKFLKTLVKSGAALDAPWGLALAPADFGTLSKALLVGNFGDGKINGYDPSTGQFIGTLATANGAFAIPGLWGIAFGNDAASQPHNTLFFAAGTNDQANGRYGRIDLP